MASVVFLRGVNVGGHRRFRPSQLPPRLPGFGLTNIGAAGTFVARGTTSPTRLRAAFEEALPFTTDIVIIGGRDIRRLVEEPPKALSPVRADETRFVSVLTKPPAKRPHLPVVLPSEGRWLVQVEARQGRLVVGRYRRDMKTIGLLGHLDEVFGVPVTTRGWATLLKVAAALATD